MVLHLLIQIFLVIFVLNVPVDPDVLLLAEYRQHTLANRTPDQSSEYHGNIRTLDLDHEQLIRTKNSVINETYLPLSTYQIKQIKKGIKLKKPIK